MYQIWVADCDVVCGAVMFGNSDMVCGAVMFGNIVLWSV
jgi:hypothetical protein